MTMTCRILFAATLAAIIIISAHGTASAQCPPGWTHKIRGVSMIFSTGGCLVEIDYCIDPTGKQIIINGYRPVMPGCPGLPFKQTLDEIEKGVIAMEANNGNYYGMEACVGPATPTTYTVSSYLCYKNLGPSLGYTACPGGTCTKTYLIQCVGGSFIYTLVSGPTKNGECPPDPECTMPNPCI